MKHISTRSCVFLLEGANKMNDEFRSKMIELRTKWMHSLFKKEYGFEPTKKVGLLGEPDIKYNQLVRAHILQIVQNSILNKLELPDIPKEIQIFQKMNLMKQ